MSCLFFIFLLFLLFLLFFFVYFVSKANPKYSGVLAAVRGWGLINGLELSVDSGLTAAALVGAAAVQGLLLVPAGAHVVRFVPPLIVTEKEVFVALQKLQAALDKCLEPAQ